jgi:O-antigen/teichoic acid export membrane protein
MHLNKTRGLAWIALIAAGINLLLNFVLIPRIGIAGAAIATFVGYLVLAVLTYNLDNQIMPIFIDWKRLSKLVLSSGLILLITWAVDNLTIDPWAKIGFKALGLLLFPVILFLVGFVSQAQGKEIMELAKSMLSKRMGKTEEQMLQ